MVRGMRVWGVVMRVRSEGVGARADQHVTTA
jgi:hypothetical protein